MTVTPQANQTGTATITLIVTDAKGARGFATFDVTVIPVAPNPPILSSYALNNQLFQLTISGDSGFNYYIQATTNLSDWQTVSTNLNAVPPFVWSDLQTTGFPSRFYRVLVAP